MSTKNSKFIDLMKGVPERTLEVIIKLLSFKGVVLAIATYLMYKGTLDTYGFIIIVGMILFDKAFLKYMGKVK